MGHKALRFLGLIKHAKKFLPSGDLQKMYRGIVEPHFSYCCSVWGCCNETKLNSLQKIQNRAARITTNSPYDASAVPLLQNLGWPPIKDLIRKETATLTSLAPQYLGELFSKCSEGSNRILRSTKTNLQMPLLRTSTGQKAFSYRGAKSWNELNKETNLASSLATFKKSIAEVHYIFIFSSTMLFCTLYYGSLQFRLFCFCTGQFVKQLFTTEICNLYEYLKTKMNEKINTDAHF